MCIWHHMLALCPKKQEKNIGYWETEVYMFTSYHVDAENWTWVLWKSNMCAEPLCSYAPSSCFL